MLVFLENSFKNLPLWNIEDLHYYKYEKDTIFSATIYQKYRQLKNYPY